MGIFAETGKKESCFFMKSRDFVYDAFISFSSKDNDIALKIVDALEAEGLKCFISSRDIGTSEEWAEKIVYSLDRSRMVVYIHTENSNKSTQIGREVQRAIDNKNLPFITYRLTDEEFQGSKAYFIASLNWIDSLVDPYENIDKLIKAVKDVKAGRPVISSRQELSHSKIWFEHNKKRIILYSLSILFFIVIILVWARCRYDAEIRESASLADYDAMVSLMTGMDPISEPEEVLNILSAIDSVAASYADTRFSKDFSFDSEEYKTNLFRQLDSVRLSLIEKISSYYEGYLVVPVEALRIPVVENISRLESIDVVLGLDTDDYIEKIKSELQ